MSSSAAQAKAQALNAKLEAEARIMLEEIDQKHARKLARQSHVCAVTCYDKAGTTSSGLGDALEHCVNQCQQPYRQGNAMVQHEVNQFQNRLNRAMADCQDKARDLMTPGDENDTRKMQKVEDALIKCIGKTVDEHIALLKPMKERIISHLKQVQS